MLCLPVQVYSSIYQDVSCILTFIAKSTTFDIIVVGYVMTELSVWKKIVVDFMSGFSIFVACEEVYDPSRECSFVFTISRFDSRRLKCPRWLWDPQRPYRGSHPVMKQPGVALTIHVHLLPLFTFMAGTGTTLSFLLSTIYRPNTRRWQHR